MVNRLTGLVPPPPDGSPEAQRARRQAAIARVAELLPVNANKVGFTTRAQTGDMVPLRREDRGAANQDAWTRHAAERTMLEGAVLDAARHPAAVAARSGAGGLGEPKNKGNRLIKYDNNRGAAFETLLRAYFWNQASRTG